jgi:hypothetical protein
VNDWLGTLGEWYRKDGPATWTVWHREIGRWRWRWWSGIGGWDKGMDLRNVDAVYSQSIKRALITTGGTALYISTREPPCRRCRSNRYSNKKSLHNRSRINSHSCILNRTLYFNGYLYPRHLHPHRVPRDLEALAPMLGGSARRRQAALCIPDRAWDWWLKAMMNVSVQYEQWWKRWIGVTMVTVIIWNSRKSLEYAGRYSQFSISRISQKASRIDVVRICPILQH